MRRRRKNQNFSEEEETKKLIYISIAVAILAVIVFAATYAIYSNVIKKQNGSEQEILGLASKQNEQTSQTSSTVGKTVNEVQESQNKNTVSEDTKIAINTVNVEKQKETTTTNTQSSTKTNTTSNNTTTAATTKKVEKVADPTFTKPVSGEVLREFANENLVYSNTLKEWVTHNGIDIKAESKEVVKASAEGTIKSIKNDPRYGITVVIEHVNGYVSVYSNLLTAEFVKEGEKVKQGQTIGTVGNTATFEIADETHLHFEILKNDVYVNPSEYIK